jgi:hypothetical protein
VSHEHGGEAEQEVVECDARRFIAADHTVEFPSGGGNIGVDFPTGEDGPMRLLIPSSIDRAVTWIDVLFAEDDDIDAVACGQKPRRCADDHVLTRLGKSVDCDGNTLTTPARRPGADRRRDGRAPLRLSAAFARRGAHARVAQRRERARAHVRRVRVLRRWRRRTSRMTEASPWSSARAIRRPARGGPRLLAAHAADVVPVPAGGAAVHGADRRRRHRRAAVLRADRRQQREPCRIARRWETAVRGSVDRGPPADRPDDAAGVDGGERVTDEDGALQISPIAKADLCRNPNVLTVYRPGAGENIAFVSCYSDDEVAAVMLGSLATVTIDVDDGPNDMVVDYLRDKLYVVNTQSSTITIIELERTPKFLQVVGRVGLTD